MSPGRGRGAWLPSWGWAKSTDQPTRNSGTSVLPSLSGRCCVTCTGGEGVNRREGVNPAEKGLNQQKRGSPPGKGGVHRVVVGKLWG